MEKPAIWQMIKEAVESLGGKTDYPAIKAFILKKWGEVNESTVNAQLITISVNQPSRVHYPQNKKPRILNAAWYIFMEDAAAYPDWEKDQIVSFVNADFLK